MTITAKTNKEEFTLYGIDFVPQKGDSIIKNDITYVVIDRVWNEDTSETIIYCSKKSETSPSLKSIETLIKEYNSSISYYK